MHNLETSIAIWRKKMAHASRLAPDTLDELESHLRETIAQMIRSGVAESDAFQRASVQLGTPHMVASEFQKLPGPDWLPAKFITGVGFAVALALLFLLLPRLNGGHRDILLAAHVLFLNFGYTAALLLGLMGICFVAERCHAEFAPRRMESIARFSSVFAGIALGFTVIGTILGMAWSYRTWGRFWSWDPKEAGALVVVGWLSCLVVTHLLRRLANRGWMVTSVLSISVVCLAWLGPNLLSVGLHQYGLPNLSGLLAAILVVNAAIFLLGFTPAGWLRLRKA